MRLRNTSGIPDDIVRQAISFVRPSGISNFDVMAKKSKARYGGMAYSQGSGLHMTANPFVTIRIGPDSLFPYNETTKQAGYLPAGWIANRLEMFVLVLAHELRHLWQAKHSRGRVWGSRGKFSERDADAYAIHMLRSWRNSPH
jgi:hypothetical protein